MFRKPSFIGTRKSLVVGAYLSRKKTTKACYVKLNMNCYPRNGQLRDLDFTRRILYHPQSVAIFATFHLVGCIEYYYKSLEDKADKTAVTTSCQVCWIDYTPQNIPGQKF